MNPYNQQLPSTTHREQEFVVLGANQPLPFHPSVQAPPQLQQFIPVLMAVFIQDIQNNVQPGKPLSIFLFNLYAQNRYQNSNFLNALQLLTHWFVIECGRGYGGPDQVIQNIVPKFRAYVTAVQTQKFEFLRTVVDYNALSACQQLINEYNALVAMIDQAMGAAPAMGHGMMPGVGGGVPFAHQPLVRPSATAPSVGGISSSVPVAGASAGRYDQAAVSVVSDDVFGNRDATPALTAAPVVEAAPAAIDPGFKVVLADESKIKWKPSKAQRTPIAYRPSRHLLYLRLPEDGTPVTQFVDDRKVGTVDYEKHRVGQSFGASAVDYSAKHNEQTAAELHETLSTFQQNQDVPQEELTDEVKQALKRVVYDMDDGALCDGSEENLWNAMAAARHSFIEDGKVPVIYHREAMYLKGVITQKDESEFVKELGAQTSFSELAKKFVQLGRVMNETLWHVCEKKITQAVNRYLKQNLTVQGTIDSFVADIDSVGPVLEQHEGELIFKAYQQGQEDLIRRTFFALAGETAEVSHAEVRESLRVFYRGSEANAPTYTFVPTLMVLTLLDMDIRELDIELDRTRPTLVTPSLTPLLYDLALDVMSQPWNKTAERFLMKTRDETILELSRGLLVENSILVKRVD